VTPRLLDFLEGHTTNSRAARSSPSGSGRSGCGRLMRSIHSGHMCGPATYKLPGNNAGPTSGEHARPLQCLPHQLTRNEAFLIAVNIAKLSSVPRQILKDIPRPPNSASRDDCAASDGWGMWHLRDTIPVLGRVGLS
jgi:hypothetical protein